MGETTYLIEKDRIVKFHRPRTPTTASSCTLPQLLLHRHHNKITYAPHNFHLKMKLVVGREADSVDEPGDEVAGLPQGFEVVARIDQGAVAAV